MALDKMGPRKFKEINYLIDTGLSDAEIAEMYGITVRTVYAIRRNRYNINHWDKEEEE